MSGARSARAAFGHAWRITLFFFEALPSLHTFTAGLRMLDGGHPRVLQIRWLTNGTSGKD